MLGLIAGILLFALLDEAPTMGAPSRAPLHEHPSRSDPPDEEPKRGDLLSSAEELAWIDLETRLVFSETLDQRPQIKRTREANRGLSFFERTKIWLKARCHALGQWLRAHGLDLTRAVAAHAPTKGNTGGGWGDVFKGFLLADGLT